MQQHSVAALPQADGADHEVILHRAHERVEPVTVRMRAILHPQHHFRISSVLGQEDVRHLLGRSTWASNTLGDLLARLVLEQAANEQGFAL